jgi:hypothetical protein
MIMYAVNEDRLFWKEMTTKIHEAVKWNPCLMFLDLRFYRFNVKYERSQVNLSTELPPCEVLLSLVFISSSPQRNLNGESQCILPIVCVEALVTVIDVSDILNFKCMVMVIG